MYGFENNPLLGSQHELEPQQVYFFFHSMIFTYTMILIILGTYNTWCCIAIKVAHNNTHTGTVHCNT
jgi:hypothetical protein